MNAEEYVKLLNTLYKPSVKTAEIVSVTAMPFAMIDGQGDPNTSKDFEDAVGALYAVSYGLKFLPKKGTVTEGYFDYRVSALEGLWDMPKGVEYTLDENGDYEPLPYPNSGEIDDPFSYDFREDFHALYYFYDDRYPSLSPDRRSKLVIRNNQIDTNRMQAALDQLVIPDDPRFSDLTKTSRLINEGFLNGIFNISVLYKRRCGDFSLFLDKLLMLPPDQAETFIEAFAKEQKADCDELTAYYDRWFFNGVYENSLLSKENP
jgi:hypothetical protein